MMHSKGHLIDQKSKQSKSITIEGSYERCLSDANAHRLFMRWGFKQQNSLICKTVFHHKADLFDFNLIYDFYA